jgi:hypothetical protein
MKRSEIMAEHQFKPLGKACKFQVPGTGGVPTYNINIYKKKADPH